MSSGERVFITINDVFEAPPDPSDRQRLLGRVGRGFYYKHRDLFVTVRECLSEADWQKTRTNAVPRGTLILREAGIPVVRLRESIISHKGKTYRAATTILFRSDKEWAVSELIKTKGSPGN